jgi:serine/threonine protein phosphatase PrpC
VSFMGPALRGLFIALLLSLLSISAALASLRQASVVPQQQDLAKAGVSVVRLLVSYTQPNQSTPKGTPSNQQGTAPTTTQQCTGLGVLVGSGLDANHQQENWVLTDANLLNTTKAACIPSQPNATLSSIEVYMSTAYNSAPASIPLVTIQANDLKNQVQTQNNLSVFPFRSASIQLLPYMDVAKADTNPDAVIYLSRGSSPVASLPTPFISSSNQVAAFKPQIQQFLTPVRTALAPTQDITSVPKEAGQPLVNSIGQLSGMALNTKTIVNTQDIEKLLQSVDALKNPPVNLVHDDWVKGMTNYYSGIANTDKSQVQDLQVAQAAFNEAFQKNPQFEGAQVFAQAAQSALTQATSVPKARATSTPSTNPLSSLLEGKKIDSMSIWLLSVVGLLLLIAIVIVGSLIFARSRARKRRLQDEFAEASHRATLEAQRIQKEEEHQLQQKQSWSQQPTMQMQPQGVNPPLARAEIKTTPLPAVPEMRCPNCGEPVAKGTTRCPNCKLWLSPSESGLHYRLTSPQQPPAAASGMPVSSLADQPTLVPSGPLPDQPTVEMFPGGPSNGQFEGDTTETYGLQRWSGRNAALAVGTQTNPGIKRRYKPNEDSLFAAQAIRGSEASSLPVGLFVVADGMGGHANGQDASRRAIQTIIDFLVPKLMKMNDLQDKELERLLGEGVQHANQAVHQNNMELRADMGTTMTAALVINTTAYVANVGDSRTYLYREGLGLRKVTNDHSVVASLVEAGIIKPDDIYTHPKRNQIYRSLGEKPVVEVDTFTVHLMPNDKLLLCSDGLWDMVRDPKIEDVIKKSTSDPNQTAEALIQAALDGGGEDNVSVIVVSVQENAQQELVPGFHLIAKPESVELPRI